MKNLTVVFLIIATVLVSGCTVEPAERIRQEFAFTPFQTLDIWNGIADFNAVADGRYWLWSDATLSDAEIRVRNASLIDAGVIPIFVAVYDDGILFCVTDEPAAREVAEELNGLNTNAFSRVMFFIDEVGIRLTGRRISSYDVDKDIFH